MRNGSDAVARSDALDAELKDNPVVMNLVKIARQHSLLLKILLGSLLFDFALSGAIFALTVKSNHTAEQASQAAKAATSAQTQAYNQCLASNDSRHSQLQLWEFILAIPPDPNLTPQEVQRQKAEAASFRNYVQKKLAPRDCHHLKPIHTGSGALRFVPVITPPRTPESSPAAPQPAAEAPPRATPRSTHHHHPKTRVSPTHSNSPTAEPSSSPTPVLCVLGHCVPPHRQSVSSSGGSVPVVVAGGLLLLVCPCWINCWRSSRVRYSGCQQEHARHGPRCHRHDSSLQHPAAP